MTNVKTHDDDGLGLSGGGGGWRGDALGSFEFVNPFTLPFFLNEKQITSLN